MAASLCRFFALSIAQSGEGKSACDGLLMKAEEDHRLALSDAYRLEIAQHKQATALWQAQHKDIMENAYSVEAEADPAARGPESEPPQLPTLIASDPTVEGRTKHLGQGRPSLGLSSD